MPSGGRDCAAAVNYRTKDVDEQSTVSGTTTASNRGRILDLLNCIRDAKGRKVKSTTVEELESILMDPGSDEKYQLPLEVKESPVVKQLLFDKMIQESTPCKGESASSKNQIQLSSNRWTKKKNRPSVHVYSG